MWLQNDLTFYNHVVSSVLYSNHVLIQYHIVNYYTCELRHRNTSLLKNRLLTVTVPRHMSTTCCRILSSYCMTSHPSVAIMANSCWSCCCSTAHISRDQEMTSSVAIEPCLTHWTRTCPTSCTQCSTTTPACLQVSSSRSISFCSAAEINRPSNDELLSSI